MSEKELEGDIRVRATLTATVDMTVSDTTIVNKAGEFRRGFFCSSEVLAMASTARNG